MTKEQINYLIKILREKYIPMVDVNDQKKGE